VRDEVVRVASDQVRVEILPSIGARVHRLAAFGHDLLRTPPSLEQHRLEPFSWGGYVMAPWCNRAPAGPVTLAQRLVDLEPNFPDGTAIHGLVHDQAWTGDDGAWHIDVAAGRWPWHHAVRVAYSVVGPRLVIDLAVENRDDAPMPAGLGWHPWFRTPVDVTIPASQVFESNLDSSIEPVPVAGPFDRRRAGPLASGIDATWTRLAQPHVELSWPQLGVRATMTMSATVTFVVAAAPADIGAVAVEAQTHGPDGVRRLIGAQAAALTRIPPGASLEGRLELICECV
jgi:aldose 1-epimerase